MRVQQYPQKANINSRKYLLRQVLVRFAKVVLSSIILRSRSALSYCLLVAYFFHYSAYGLIQLPADFALIRPFRSVHGFRKLSNNATD